VCVSSNNIRHPVTKAFTPLHCTSLHFTKLHVTPLHFLSFKLHLTTLHYPNIRFKHV